MITEEQVKSAIKAMINSKAIALDGISTLHLKHFRPKIRSYLACLISMSLSTGRIPAIWKTSMIIPLQKPASEPSSYRPVSIISPIARLAEKIVQEQIVENAELPGEQHGFRKGYSTSTALTSITEKNHHRF